MNELIRFDNPGLLGPSAWGALFDTGATKGRRLSDLTPHTHKHLELFSECTDFLLKSEKTLKYLSALVFPFSDIVLILVGFCFFSSDSCGLSSSLIWVMSCCWQYLLLSRLRASVLSPPLHCFSLVKSCLTWF